MPSCRLLITNRIQAAATSRSVSSESATLPATYLLDQMRSKVWRSGGPWVIVAGFNDKIDFNRGGVKAATIAPGTYATGAALCAAIVTALVAADATPVWAASYSGSTFKFTISSDIAFVLLFGTGANAAVNAYPELGFTAADTASAVSHEGGTAAYQSRHYVKADFGSALSLTAAIAINHNVSAGGTITFQANAADAWTAPTVNQALATTFDEDSVSPAGRLVYFASQTLRYGRFVFNDCGNSAGHAEAGILFAGPYTQPQFMYSIDFQKRRVDQSVLQMAAGGAHYRTARPKYRDFALSWVDLPDADRAVLEAAFDEAPSGKDFFFAFDTDDLGDIHYGHISGDVSVAVASGDYYDISVPFRETLG